MPHVETGSIPADAAIVRQTVFADLVPVSTFAAAVNRCPRTVLSWVAQGMPMIRIGQSPYIPTQPARDWLIKRGSRDLSPRRPGRPATRNAA